MINQSCPLGCRPLACGRISTGLWKHVYWPVETCPQASGNTYTAKWTTRHRQLSDASSPVGQRVLTWGRRVLEAAEKSPDVGRKYRCNICVSH